MSTLAPSARQVGGRVSYGDTRLFALHTRASVHSERTLEDDAASARELLQVYSLWSRHLGLSSVLLLGGTFLVCARVRCNLTQGPNTDGHLPVLSQKRETAGHGARDSSLLDALMCSALAQNLEAWFLALKYACGASGTFGNVLRCDAARVIAVILPKAGLLCIAIVLINAL